MDASYERYEARYAAWLQHPDLGLRERYPVHELIEGDPFLPLKGYFVLGDLYDRIEGPREKFFLHPRICEQVPLDTYMIEQAHFVERPDWREGRLDSQHKVFFGTLTLIADDPESSTTHVPVAVKPFHGDRKLAIHEYVSNEYMNEQGFIRAFQPLGFWVDGDGNIFLLTEFEEGVTSLDNYDWQRELEDPLEQHLSVFQGLEWAAFSLARWHSHGYAHSDPQVKNIGVDSQGLRAIDLETLQRFTTPEVADLDEIEQWITHDLGRLLWSIRASGYLSDALTTDEGRVVETALVRPYQGAMRHPSSPLQARNGLNVSNVVDAVCKYVLENPDQKH